MRKELTEYDQNNIDLAKSLATTKSYFGEENICGNMNPERVNLFLKWIVANRLEHPAILDQDLFTNELLE